MIEELNISLASLRNENKKLLAKAKDFDVCYVTISNLTSENDILHAKVVELKSCKPSTSVVEHVSICTRCRDVDINAIHDHMSLIKQQNDHIAKIDAKIAEHNLENEKFKFAHSMLYNGRRPSIKDGIGFQQGSNVKLNAPKKLSNFVKGKTPWFRIMRVTFYILQTIPNIRLGRFMLENLIIFLTMHLCIKMRLLALGIPHMLKCLERKFMLHQMNIMSLLILLMHHMF